MRTGLYIFDNQYFYFTSETEGLYGSPTSRPPQTDVRSLIKYFWRNLFRSMRCYLKTASIKPLVIPVRLLGPHSLLVAPDSYQGNF